MDEFKDIDKELERLREEIASRDEGTRQFANARESDYWKRRLDEEKILLNKKLAAKEEEKKLLETRLSQQQLHIDQYNQHLAELEKKFELETKHWEEKLRAKELDLVLEKNRILSEEKIAQAETENKHLMEQVNELNVKISELKSEHIDERKKFGEYFAQEREVYVEKLKAHAKQIELLEQRIKELENEAVLKAQELEKAKQEFTAQLQAADERVKDAFKSRESVEKAKESVEKEKQGLQTAIDQLKKKHEEDKKQIEESAAKAGKLFTQGLRDNIGPLAGVIHGISSGLPARPLWNVFKDIVQKLESEVESFSKTAKEEAGYKKPFLVASLMSDEDLFIVERALPNSKAEIVRLELKEPVKAIAEKKPQALIVSKKNLALAQNIHTRIPFLPVIIFGELKKGLAKRLAADGFLLLAPPHTDEEVAAFVVRTAYHSIARPEIWGRIILNRSRTIPIAAGVMLLLAVIGYGIYGKYSPLPKLLTPSMASFATPYPQPTNVAYDGKYLWGCDWTGQSIYKHNINGNLSLERIYYFPGKRFSALTWSGGTLWSTDAWDKKIHKHNLDDTLSIAASYNAPNFSPSGITGNGTMLWTCDSTAQQIYRHRLDGTLSVEAIYPSPGASPSGLYFDGKYLWSCDSKANRIYRHRLDNELSVESTYMPPNSSRKGYNITGITGNGKIIWVCSEKSGNIYQYPLEYLEKVK